MQSKGISDYTFLEENTDAPSQSPRATSKTIPICVFDNKNIFSIFKSVLETLQHTNNGFTLPKLAMFSCRRAAGFYLCKATQAAACQTEEMRSFSEEISSRGQESEYFSFPILWFKSLDLLRPTGNETPLTLASTT